MYDEFGRTIGEWWIESRDKKRYKPFKPMPIFVRQVIDNLDKEALNEIWDFLLFAKEGEAFSFHVELPLELEKSLPPIRDLSEFKISSNIKFPSELLYSLLNSLRKLVNFARTKSLRINYFEDHEGSKVEIEVK